MAAGDAEIEADAGAEPLDLVGEWTQTNSNSETTFQEATITADAVTVMWVMEESSSTSLFWAGSYVPPTEAANSYTWDSANDTEQTDASIMASSDETKTFTYEDGVLMYEVSMAGVTMTVELERR